MINQKNIYLSYNDIYKKIKLWNQNAKQSFESLKLSNHNAATLATSVNNIPNARIVLVKDITLEGLTFFTNYNSKKSEELESNKNATLLFYWEPINKQLKIQGVVSKTPTDVSKAYFYSRPKESQISAWSSFQSAKLSDYSELINRYDEITHQYLTDIPYLPNWGGFILQPNYIEFWEGADHRLHKRTIFEKQQNKDQWLQYYLNP